MLPSSTTAAPAPSRSRGKIDFRVVAGVLLLAVAIGGTWRTVEGLSARRELRLELAEMSHARYGLLSADAWVKALVPIMNSVIDGIDLTAKDRVSLRPTVEAALYNLLDNVKAQMSAPKTEGSSGGGGFSVQGNAMVVNMIVAALKPHVPEYANVVLAQLGTPKTKQAVKEYIKNTIKDGARNTFGDVDMTWHNSILKRYGCADAKACQQELGRRINAADAQVAKYYLAALAATLVAFVLLLTGRPVLRRSGTVVLLLFCIVLLVGGVITPMLEVEAKLSQLSMKFWGQPVVFTDQVLYFQSKSVLEVFHTLITMGRPDMWFVGVLVLTFCIIFPTIKLCTLSFCLYNPAWLRKNRVVKFFALESSKWSMADVLALAIFMSFVAFNGLIVNTMGELTQTGAEVVIPTDSSKILPGYHLFIGFCLAGLFLSKKLARGIQINGGGEGE